MTILQSNADGDVHADSIGIRAAASPTLVTRGETTHPNQVAHIDWLAFTVHPAEDRNWRWLRTALKEIFDIPETAWRGTKRQWSGYKHRIDLIYPLDRGETINLGLVAYGGESQKGTMHVLSGVKGSE